MTTTFEQAVDMQAVKRDYDKGQKDLRRELERFVQPGPGSSLHGLRGEEVRYARRVLGVLTGPSWHRLNGPSRRWNSAAVETLEAVRDRLARAKGPAVVERLPDLLERLETLQGLAEKNGDRLVDAEVAVRQEKERRWPTNTERNRLAEGWGLTISYTLELAANLGVKLPRGPVHQLGREDLIELLQKAKKEVPQLAFDLDQVVAALDDGDTEMPWITLVGIRERFVDGTLTRPGYEQAAAR